MDPEKAHDLGLRLIAGGFVSARIPDDPALACRAFGTELRHPIGLAAGFDKNGIALEGLHGLGFSFVEVGTVTPQPQLGNEKPRMFRLLQHRAIINRLGFNGQGAKVVARNLERTDVPMPYGINIGKNKWTANDDAWMDYRDAARTLRDFGQYFAINVSSPNTPDLRALQTRDDLARIINAVRAAGVDKPLFIKVSPDQADDDLAKVAAFAGVEGVGIIATNKTISREGVDSEQTGGLSGAPLLKRALEVCRFLRRTAKSGTEIIAVGGLETGEDLEERIAAGANACQIYTSLVYRGPQVVRLMLDEYTAPR
jgi:dihydroorotate dehydrogenase